MYRIREVWAQILLSQLLPVQSYNVKLNWSSRCQDKVTGRFIVSETDLVIRNVTLLTNASSSVSHSEPYLYKQIKRDSERSERIISVE